MGKEDASSIKHWPEDERPRERLVKFGGDALSDAQLLAILIGSGDGGAKKTPLISAETFSRRLTIWIISTALRFMNCAR